MRGVRAGEQEAVEQAAKLLAVSQQELAASRAEVAMRSEVKTELNFPPKLRGARSRLYRRRFLQVNTRWN